jgi:FMN phosphatase YigB (HAD superfamily)
MTKKIIFIDWNKTLSHSLFWERLRDTDSLTYDKIEKWLFIENRSIINSWMKGDVGSKEVIRSMSKDINKPYDFLWDEFVISCRHMEWSIDGLETYIRKIRRNGTKVVIATDNMDSFLEYTIPGMKLNELFDDWLVSSEIGHLKDEEELQGISFFDDYLNKHNVTYKDVVLLDDSEDKTGKYKRYMFERILIDSPKTLETALKLYAKS